MADSPQTPAPVSAPSKEQLAREKVQRNYRKARRKQRERAGEIRELNITAMMDMMTIILVFLLKSYSTSSLNVDMSDNLKIPQSTTIEKPQDIIKVTVSLKEVTVNDKAAVPIRDGLIPVAAKDGKADNFYVGALYDSLKKEVDKQKKIAQYNEQARKVSGRVNIVADRRIPYRTLIDVLYTAGQAELGEYQFMVLRAD
jgi:biopolymer transport protein ExbD